ncbi:uncharacterized protein [Nothobranchius furzeri]|uniref:uncharacterized protein n=1 Tax=Nothobranchius furzeri TaxID=105023 RepID=UPI003904BFF3
MYRGYGTWGQIFSPERIFCTRSGDFTQRWSGRTSGSEYIRPQMVTDPALCVSPCGSHLTHAHQSENRGPGNDYYCAPLAIKTLAGGDHTTPLWRTVAPAPTQRSAISGARGGFPPTPGEIVPLGLARELSNLQAVGLPQRVIETIQGARAPSTRSLYDCKWSILKNRCGENQEISFQCSVVVVLTFLQDLMDKGKAFSTIKVHLAAISACHIGFEGKSVGQHPLVSRFMRGVQRQVPVSKNLAPPWDLPLVLEALMSSPFEPLEQVDLKVATLKMALLLALVSAKRVGEIHVLSVHPSCTKFSQGDSKVALLPNPTFMPKVLGACSPISLVSLCPPPFSSVEQQNLHALCPVRALRIYMDRTENMQKSNQLFVSWAKNRLGKPISKQGLSHWIVGAISLAYNSKGALPPESLHAHSTRGLSSSWARFKGVSIQEICALASWTSPHTFTRFYKLDVTTPSLAHSVLGMAQTIGAGMSECLTILPSLLFRSEEEVVILEYCQ